MRPWHSICLTLLFWSCDNGARAAAQRHSDPASVTCDVATALAQTMVVEELGHLVFATDDNITISVIRRKNSWLRPWGKKTIPRTLSTMALVRRLQEQGGQNAIERCASARKMLSAKGVGYGRAAVEIATRRNQIATSRKNPRAGISIYHLSLPVISPDGKQALVAVDFSRGGMVNGSALQLLERDIRGRWKVIGIAPLLIG